MRIFAHVQNFDFGTSVARFLSERDYDDDKSERKTIFGSDSLGFTCFFLFFFAVGIAGKTLYLSPPKVKKPAKTPKPRSISCVTFSVWYWQCSGGGVAGPPLCLLFEDML